MKLKHVVLIVLAAIALYVAWPAVDELRAGLVDLVKVSQSAPAAAGPELRMSAPVVYPAVDTALYQQAQPTAVMPTQTISPGRLADCAYNQATGARVSSACPANAAELLGQGR